MQGLNKTQRAVFEYIKSFLFENGVAPSVREIGQAVGLKSTCTVQYNLNALEEAGYIIREPNLKRTIRIAGMNSRVTQVPVVGTVTAGHPIPAEEYVEEYIPVEMRRAGDYFALHIKGDSMIGAHIMDGDLAIVERTPIAENGDIVVALIDNEATVKRFYKENDCFRLQPENDAFDPILVRELAILGKVVKIIRDY